MSDPFSITAGVVAVASFAYSSCKTLNDTIKGFLNAPKILNDARKDLDAIQNLLQSLVGVLNGVQNSALSPNQQACFINLKPAIQHCEATCSGFAARLSQITSRSGPDHVNWFDRARIHFNDNDISLLKAALERDKQTLDVALGMATFQTVRQNRDALQSLETKIADSMSEFTGQIEGLQLAMRSLSLSGFNIKKEDVDLVVKVLNEHDKMLKQCLKVCESGLKETSVGTGTNVKHAVAFNKASLFVGNMGYDGKADLGTSAVTIDLLEATDQARSAAGNMSADVAKAFWS